MDLGRERRKGVRDTDLRKSRFINMNMGKEKRWNVPLVWVASTNEVLEEIRKFTNGVDEYWVVG